MSAETLAAQVKARAIALGFDRVGVTDLGPVPHGDALEQWLNGGMAGTMGYMHRQKARRLEPARILPGATRAVVVTRGYYEPDPPPADGAGLVAKYARGPDYHDTLGAPLADLADYVRSLGPPGTVAKAYVDAGPVPERELAQRAGIGWIGKNTMLIDPDSGSFMFLGVVLTSLDLAIDQPFQADRCGTCRRCLDACPTGAFTAARVLDARRCISYLTIEHDGPIDRDLAKQMGTRVFGCDVCQDVCPWNVRFAEAVTDSVRERVPAWLDLRRLAEIDHLEMTARFAGTALTRPGASGLRRNAAVALQNGKGDSG